MPHDDNRPGETGGDNGKESTDGIGEWPKRGPAVDLNNHDPTELEADPDE